MARQPKYLPLERSDFFADARSARPLEPGTVARGYLRTDRRLYAGMREPEAQRARLATIIGAAGVNPFTALGASLTQSPYVETFPFPVTPQVMERGQLRFRIFCAVCHDAAGTGRGIVVQRGFTQPPSYHIDRLRTAPVGYFYDVVTNGYGSMPSHAAEIPPRDRWAIIAYLRALQLSQHARLAALPEPAKQAALRALEIEREPRK